jgi:hypothetical protein
MPSHRFSIPARVGFEMAWALRIWDWLVMGGCWVAEKEGASDCDEVWKLRIDEKAVRVQAFEVLGAARAAARGRERRSMVMDGGNGGLTPARVES